MVWHRAVMFDHSPGERSPARLSFTSRERVRYVSVFPADWATLSTEQLIALSHGAPQVPSTRRRGEKRTA
jgi:hypothetical protein